MTAFAAILQRDRKRLAATEVSRVAAALGEVYGTPAITPARGTAGYERIGVEEPITCPCIQLTAFA